MAIPKGYFTTQELIDNYPEVVRNFRLNATKLGQLLDLDQLLGFFDPSTKRNYTLESSFFLLIAYRNRLLDLSKVPLKTEIPMNNNRFKLDPMPVAFTLLYAIQQTTRSLRLWPCVTCWKNTPVLLRLLGGSKAS